MVTADIDTIYDRQLVKVNDVILHVIKAGPPDGDLVILLHGFPEFWYGWRHQIDALAAAGYRVIVPDQRGYNKSDKPRDVGAYRLENLTSDISALIDWAGRGTAHVIGHDWGASVAWSLALTRPHRIKKLGILNVPHPKVFSDTLKDSWEQKRKSWYFGLFQIPWLPETMMSLGGYGFAERAMRNSGKSTTFSDADMQFYREAWSRPGAMRSMINWYRAIAQFPPLSPASWQLKMPVLMLWGMRDVALSSEMAPKSMDYCDNGRLVTFPDATHWVQHDEKEAVSQHLLDFLAE